jgi:hypothetical protein
MHPDFYKQQKNEFGGEVKGNGMWCHLMLELTHVSEPLIYPKSKSVSKSIIQVELDTDTDLDTDFDDNKF